MTVFTIGYGGRGKWEEFAALLKANGVASVADVRLQPQHSALGLYVKAKTPDKGIEARLRAEGIGYRSLTELGNPFRHDHDWPEKFKRLMDEQGDVMVNGLLDLPAPYCLLCAEKRPEECHRTIIADYLASKRGCEVVHLR